MTSLGLCERPKTCLQNWSIVPGSKLARRRSIHEYFQGMREESGDAALPYQTVSRWGKAFREGRDAVQDNLRTR